ncbi:MAG: ATP-dependent zinc metalloprotease FtsH [Gammaproteobacteria bacterium]|nr:ATP-dependent zinc metalloprotease FtsH [Gammaproteobacteria bacterium]
MGKTNQINVAYAMGALLLLLIFQAWWSDWRGVDQITYSEFQTLLKDGDVASIRVGSRELQGQLRQARPDGHLRFSTVRVEPEFARELAASNVEFAGLIESTFWRDILSWVLPTLFFFAIWMLVIRRMAEKQGLGGLMSIGKSRAKVYVERATGVKFEDVAGVDEAKEELQEVVDFLKDPVQHGRLGARIPKGVLLVGPPGTGKTLLARAVAGQAGVPFFSISGAEFVEMFVGVGAARVRDLFDQARQTAPSIIFIDELDALGRARGYGNFGGGHDEKEQTLNQLLSELDGFDPSSGIVLLGATNRPEVLDPALLRAGRFDRQVLVDRPDRSGRLQILNVHARKISRAEGLDLAQIAALTPGFTGADLANLVNEAALLATRRKGESVTADDFTRAIERIVAGVEKHSRLMGDEERHAVAVHEIGHALVAMSLPAIDAVHKVSIIPRGIGALGYTLQRPTEDRFLMTRQHLKDRMAVLMGGRAGEALTFNEISTGAADDLDKVTEIARHMVMRYGMVESVGQVVYDEAKPHFLGEGLASGAITRSHGEATAREIDLAVKALLEEAFGRAMAILQRRRAALEAGAALLLVRESLTAEELPFRAEYTPTLTPVPPSSIILPEALAS